MGFFDDYTTDVDSIPTGFGLPLGTYPVVISDLKNFQKKDGTWSTVISFTVDTVNDEEGRSGKDDIWLTKPVKGDKNAAIAAQVGKQTLLDIGVPESALGSFDADRDKDKIVGTTGVLSVTAGKDPAYPRKKFVKTAEDSGVAEEAVLATVPESKAEAPLDLEGW
jgi:hypothetical protein